MVFARCAEHMAAIIFLLFAPTSLPAAGMALRRTPMPMVGPPSVTGLRGLRGGTGDEFLEVFGGFDPRDSEDDAVLQRFW